MVGKIDDDITPFQRRMMIGGHWLLEGAPMQSEWYGNDGMIAKTLTLVGLPRMQANHHLIERVFKEVDNCISTSTNYAGVMKQEREGHSHRPPVIAFEMILLL